ncbi:MAG: hypothetical protein Q6373_007850 [Candidatus Sigynarchaeota archaeon]
MVSIKIFRFFCPRVLSFKTSAFKRAFSSSSAAMRDALGSISGVLLPSALPSRRRDMARAHPGNRAFIGDGVILSSLDAFCRDRLFPFLTTMVKTRAIIIATGNKTTGCT